MSEQSIESVYDLQEEFMNEGGFKRIDSPTQIPPYLVFRLYDDRNQCFEYYLGTFTNRFFRAEPDRSMIERDKRFEASPLYMVENGESRTLESVTAMIPIDGLIEHEVGLYELTSLNED